MSKRSSGGTSTPSALRVHCSGLNLLAPCDVPIEMASESTPVFFTKSSTSSGTGVGMVFGRNLVLDTGQHTQLALHRHIVLVGILLTFFVSATFSS